VTGRLPRCEWCAQPAAPGDTSCDSCGGPIRVLEPWVLDCGWCGCSNRRDETATCSRCGGPLPSIPGSHPGPRPPEAPRALPWGYRARSLLWKNTLALVGAMFTILFCWAVITPLIGIPMWVRAHRRARRRLDALVHGVPTRGQLLGVWLDGTQAINDRHPYRIEFEYETPGGPLRGAVEGWDPVHAQRPVGEHVWVVYLESQPEVHALWPPVR
jgi:hypothetical protein